MLKRQLQGSCLHVRMAADVSKLLTADVKVGEGGAIGHGGMGLYLQVGKEWEGTLGGRQKCRCADRKGVDEYIKA